MERTITKTGTMITFAVDNGSLTLKDTVLQEAEYKISGGSLIIKYLSGTETDEMRIPAVEVTNPVSATPQALLTNILALVATQAVILGTPVNAVASQGMLTLTAGTGNTILTTKTVTVGGKVYTFKTALTPTEGEVLIGATDTTALANLLAAINHTGTPDTDYKCAAVNPLVTGIDSDATTLIVENKVKGVIGNLSAVATTIAGAWDDTTLGEEVLGVDGTVGDINVVYQDADFIYLTIGNTIADANWKKITKETL